MLAFFIRPSTEYGAGEEPCEGGHATRVEGMRRPMKHPGCTYKIRLFPSSLVVSAPPCSLYGPACSSVHKRTAENPLGDLSNFKVRLAKRIWLNFVACLKKIQAKPRCTFLMLPPGCETSSAPRMTSRYFLSAKTRGGQDFELGNLDSATESVMEVEWQPAFFFPTKS